jgi:hypothetical protein
MVEAARPSARIDATQRSRSSVVESATALPRNEWSDARSRR